MTRHSVTTTLSILLPVLLLLAIGNLLFGSVDIPFTDVWGALAGGEVERESWRYIVLESRLPQTVTAMLCGASLAVSGLILQTTFRNPLAGPSILGITNGASLGVALVMLFAGGAIKVAVSGVFSISIASFAVVIAAFLGAVVIILLLLFISTLVASELMLLIVGILISYLTSSVVLLLNVFASADNVQSYVMWGMGSFSDTTLAQLPWVALFSILALICALMMIKPLNVMLLGDMYAQNLGADTRSIRRMLLIVTGVLTAIATATCGPISFIGLAVPHMARLFARTSDNMVLLPATILMGAIVALLCNLICVIPEATLLPINAVTPLFGVPVIIYIMLHKRGKSSTL